MVNQRKEGKLYDKLQPDLVRDVPKDAIGSPRTPEIEKTLAEDNHQSNSNSSTEEESGKSFYCLSFIKDFVFAFLRPNIFSKLRGETKQRVDNSWEINIDEINELQWIGSGAQGVVFLGKWKNQDVAIKKVRTQRDTEIKHLRDLDHKNIVKFRYLLSPSVHNLGGFDLIEEKLIFGNVGIL